MKSKTVRENFGFNGKVHIYKDGTATAIYIDVIKCIGNSAPLTPKRARELFQAGLKMCDELLEGK